MRNNVFSFKKSLVMLIQHALWLTCVSCIQMVKFNGMHPYTYNATLCTKPFKVIKQVSPLLLSNDSVFSFVKCLALFGSADHCPVILKASRRNCGSPAVDLCWLHVELMCSCLDLVRLGIRLANNLSLICKWKIHLIFAHYVCYHWAAIRMTQLWLASLVFSSKKWWTETEMVCASATINHSD